MRRGISSWILYSLVFVHLLAVVGISGIFLMFVSTSQLSGIYKLLILVLVSFVNAIIIDSMFSYINRIIRRRNRNL
jgi:hypothetical protein